MSGVGDGSQPAGDDDDVAEDAPEPKKKHDGRLPTSKLRSFAGSRAEYEEWKREMDANMMLSDVPKHHMATLIFLALESGPGKLRALLKEIR